MLAEAKPAGAPDINGERGDRLYRFSVKCDRAMNARIEGAARQAGLTTTAFVQKHFETILDRAAGGRPALENFNARSFAERHGIPGMAARVWHWMATHADADSRAQGSTLTIAAAVGCDRSHVSISRDALVEAGLITLEDRGGGRVAPVYRMMWEAA